MLNRTGFEKSVVKLEHLLSAAAVVPVLGSIAGAAKVILGTIQTIGALLAMVCSSFPALCSKCGREVFCMGGSHFVNGLGNIVAGALEAVPLVGSAVFMGTKLRRDAKNGQGTTGQGHFILGYSHLETKLNPKVHPLIAV